jgi:hypothetical protein
MVKDSLFSWLLFVKKMSLESNRISSRNGLKTLSSQTCVILTLGIINFVAASENITFMFSCLIHIPERVLCWIQVIAGTVSQQEKRNDENKKTWTVTSISLLVLFFKVAHDDQSCHIKFLKKVFKFKGKGSINPLKLSGNYMNQLL